ncbi:type I restriction endonuclease, partial [Acinetobacter baumannii]
TGIDLIETNEKGHTLLTFGIALGQTDADGRRQDRTVRFLDFDTPANNRFEYARQIRLRGPRQEIIPDILIYVNGLPLCVIECKAPG